MVKKQIEKIATRASTPTIISADLSIEGEVKSSGLIEVEGTVSGNVNGHSVIIRENGTVSGTLTCNNLQLKGKFEGELNAKSINISNKAFLKGDISYETLSVEDGALIDGQFKRVNSEVRIKNDNRKEAEKTEAAANS